MLMKNSLYLYTQLLCRTKLQEENVKKRPGVLVISLKVLSFQQQSGHRKLCALYLNALADDSDPVGQYVIHARFNPLPHFVQALSNASAGRSNNFR